MPMLKKFMCCCQLTTGGVLIGWIGLVLQVMILAGDSAALANLETNCEGSGIYGRNVNAVSSAAKIPLSICLATTVISVITHILLLWGTNTKNRLLLLPWLISTMTIIVVVFLSVIIVGCIMTKMDADVRGVVAVFVVGFLIAGILLYLWLCILSLYEEFRGSVSGRSQNVERA